MNNHAQELYEFGPFRLDPGKRLLLRNSQPVPLQPKAFETLLVLVRTNERVVSKDDLLKAVWPDTFVEESNLAQNVFMLRKALGETVGDHRYIVTIPGRGYRFAEKVRVVTGEETLALEHRSRTRVVIEERKPWRALAIWVVGLTLSLSLVGTAGYRYYRQHQSTQSGSKPITVLSRRSVAVFGFQNLSGKSDSAWLSTAFAEMLTTELRAGDQLRTVSSEEVAHLQTSLSISNSGTLSRDTLARVRQDIGADIVVLGSYSDLGKQARGKIRLDLQVQDTAAGETLSSFSETGTEEDLFQLVSRAGADLREKLKIRVISAELVAGVQASLPSNTEAARLYSEGLEKIRHFDDLAATKLLEQAIKTDPGFALAHSALAEAWSQLGYEARAQSEAQKAFELSGKLPRRDRLFIEAAYQGMNHNWDKAAALYRIVFDFFPDDIESGLHLADAQSRAGKRNDASLTILSLRKLQVPTRDDMRIDFAEEMNDLWQGEYSTARAVALRTVQRARATGLDLTLAKALYLEAATLGPLGESDQAIAAAQESMELYQAVGDQWGVSNALEQLAYVHALQDEPAEAEKIYRQDLAINRTLGSKLGEAIDLISIAAERKTQGDVEGGKKLDEQALAIFRQLGDRNRQAQALMGIAWTLSAEDNSAGSLTLDEEALAIYRQVGDDNGAAYALSEKTIQLMELGRLNEAQEANRQALELAHKTGVKSSIAGNLFNWGNIAKHEWRLDDADKIFSEALATDRFNAGLCSQIEISLSEVSDARGNSKEAKQHLDQSLAYIKDSKDPIGEIGAYSFLAEIAAREGNLAEARRQIEAARAFLPRALDRDSYFDFGIANARVQAASGKFAEARKFLQAIVAETTKSGNVLYEFEARLALCELEAKTDPAAAKAHVTALAGEASSKGLELFAHKARALGL